MPEELHMSIFELLLEVARGARVNVTTPVGTLRLPRNHVITHCEKLGPENKLYVRKTWPERGACLLTIES